MLWLLPRKDRSEVRMGADHDPTVTARKIDDFSVGCSTGRELGDVNRIMPGR